MTDEKFILGDRNVWRTYRPIIDAICIDAGFVPNVVQEASTSEALLGLVSAGAATTLYVRGNVEWPGVHYVDLPEVKTRIETYLMWRRRQLSPIVEQFLNLAREFAWRPGNQS